MTHAFLQQGIHLGIRIQKKNSGQTLPPQNITYLQQYSKKKKIYNRKATAPHESGKFNPTCEFSWKISSLYNRIQAVQQHTYLQSVGIYSSHI